MLEDLKFLDSKKVEKDFQKIEQLLVRNKQNLIIDLNDFKGKEEMVKHNILEVFLAMQNL